MILPAQLLVRGLVLAVFTFLMTTALVGCTQPPKGEKARNIVHFKSPKQAAAPYGPYLAARVARGIRDTKSASDYFSQALDLDPENDTLRRRVFLLNVIEGKIDEAIALGAPLEGGQNLFIERIVFAVDAFRRNDNARGLALLQAAEGAPRNNLLQPMLVAWGLMANGDSDAGLKAIQDSDDSQQSKSVRAYHKALMLDLADRKKPAQAAYKALVASDRPGSIRAVLAAASFYSRADDFAAANDLIARFQNQDMTDRLLLSAQQQLAQSKTLPPIVAKATDGMAEALYGAAGALLRERTREGAKLYLGLALHLRPQFDAARILLAEILQADRRYEDSYEMFSQIPNSSPYWLDARIRMADALSRLERNDDAIAHLQDTVEESNADEDALAALGDLLRAEMRYTEAVSAYSRILDNVDDLQPRHWNLLYTRGIAYERAKDWPPAEQDFLKALELRPEEPLVLNYLGYSWVEQKRNLDRALEMIRLAVEKRPDDGYIVDSLGWVLYRLGDFEGAVENLERAVLLRPEDPIINDHLGDAYWRVGRKREARYQWQHALGLEPEDEQREKLEAKLRADRNGRTPQFDSGS